MLCDHHDSQLRASLDAAGLSPQIPDNPVEAMERFVDRGQHGLCKDNFDPLFIGRQSIMLEAARAVGAIPLRDCSICTVDLLHGVIGQHECIVDERGYERWIGDVAYELLDCWEKLNR